MGDLKRIKTISALFIMSVLLSGCTGKVGVVDEQGEKGLGGNSQIGKCKTESVFIEGYGEKGKRLANCFVEYPGEPTREDKSYYVVEDVCGQFTKEFVQNMLEKPILRIEPPDHDSLFNCRYYLDDKNDHVLLVFEYLKIENQKIGNESMGRRTEENDKIPMRNMLVWQEDGKLNNIYLVLGDEKFISIDRSSSSTLTDEEMIDFAARIGEEIKEYK